MIQPVCRWAGSLLCKRWGRCVGPTPPSVCPAAQRGRAVWSQLRSRPWSGWHWSPAARVSDLCLAWSQLHRAQSSICEAQPDLELFAGHGRLLAACPGPPLRPSLQPGPAAAENPWTGSRTTCCPQEHQDGGHKMAGSASGWSCCTGELSWWQ